LKRRNRELGQRSGRVLEDCDVGDAAVVFDDALENDGSFFPLLAKRIWIVWIHLVDQNRRLTRRTLSIGLDGPEDDWFEAGLRRESEGERRGYVDTNRFAIA
jgi:hypothetical protein